MDADNGGLGKLGLPGDKENRACEEGVPQNEAGKEFGTVTSLCVRLEGQPGQVSSQAAAEPLSPSKRFNIGNADFQPATQPELPTCDSTSDKVEAKQQICFDYTKGVCKRGTTCKYSHDVEEIVRVNSQERGVCFDFLRNSCQRGLLCRFSHDLTSIVVQDQGQKAGRKNAPICYDFVKGVCKREDCRYSHDIFSIIRGKNEGSGPEICYDFTRGKCNRGSACRYSHDLQHAEGLSGLAGLSTDAVAAIAAQHAQLAAATAVAVEASRRQSAPGCLQAGQDPLLGWLNNLQAPLTAGLGDAAAVSQAALALQLQSQWLMQLQAQAANALQSQVAPAIPPSFESAPQAAPQLWQNSLSAALLAQQATGQVPQQVQLPPTPSQLLALQELRRHTHDGCNPQGSSTEVLMHQLQQQLSLCSNAGSAEQQPKMGVEVPRHAPSDSLSGASTIGANWQSGRSTPANPRQPPLPAKHHLHLHRSLSLSQPPSNFGPEQAQRLQEAAQMESYRIPDIPGAQAANGGFQQVGVQNQMLTPPPRVAYNLRTFPSNPVTKTEQDSLFAANQAGEVPAWQSAQRASQLSGRLGSLPCSSETFLQAGQAGTEPVQSISFEDRPQTVARDQLAFFQEIWRQ